jgi:uncharacterized coiled-coil protein SlyX
MTTTFNVMRMSLDRWRIIAAALIAAVLLAACGTLPLRLGYGNGPRLLYWWLDGYVSLTEAQAPVAREAIGAWFRWHRQSELPRYAGLLAQVRQQLHEPTTPQALCALWQDVRAHGDAALEPALPAIASFVRTLSMDQVGHVERRFEKVNRDFRDEHLHPDPARRQHAAHKRARERAEMLYGPLEPAQRELLTRAAAVSPFDVHLWNAERLARQADILATLRAVLADPQAAPAQTQAALAALVRRLQSSPRDAYREYQGRLTAHNCRVAAQLHNSASAAQREHARERLRAWEADLRELSAQAAGPAE